MQKQLSKLTAIVTTLILTAGCAVTPAKDYLRTSTSKDLSTLDFSKLVAHVRETRTSMELVADKQQELAEATGLTLVGTGLVAAAGIAYGAHIDFLAGAGIVGTGIGAANTMYKPLAVREAYLNAAGRMTCLASASTDMEQIPDIQDFHSHLTGLQLATFSNALNAVKADVDALHLYTAADSAVINRSKHLADVFTEVIRELQLAVSLELPDINSLVTKAIAARDSYEAQVKREESATQNLSGVGQFLAQEAFSYATYPEKLNSCLTTGSSNP